MFIDKLSCLILEFYYLKYIYILNILNRIKVDVNLNFDIIKCNGINRILDD